MMYLGRTLTTLDGAQHRMAGVLPMRTAMLQQLRVLGYAEVEWWADSLWGSAGEKIRGHEYHYSEMLDSPPPSEGWEPAYTVYRRRRIHPWMTGLAQGNILAGYIHLHWASRPAAAVRFLSHCRRSS
jgi:cobyrinic acid a,c-diamide synthase